MKKRALISTSAALVIIIALVAGLIFYGPNSDDVEELDGVEVREYQGQDLSSINDFRENSIKGPQYVDIENYRLEITGLVASPASYEYDEVIDDNDHYKKVVRLNCVEGWAVNILWEGILVRDILEEAGPLPEANTIIFHAYDGYTTSFPLWYMDLYDILMAYRLNEVTLPPERGYPFQLVAESKWGYKWIKWITKIELSDDPEYRGYWESRGYSNDAGVNTPFFDF